MRILVYGAGVIGSLYAAHLHDTGFDVSLLARGKRLENLRRDGLLRLQDGTVRQTTLPVLDSLTPEDIYDYIFLTVREDQLTAALAQLRDNCSPTIVTMVNTIQTYDTLDTLCGRGRLLPAFPGAGGSLEDGVLDAGFAPRIIQPTTFAEIDGSISPRVRALQQVFRTARIPCQVVPDMHRWQICHLAMVVPLADAYYRTDTPESVGLEQKLMKQTATQLHKNFANLHHLGPISPPKLNIFRLCPTGLLAWALPFIYQSRFGNRFMYRHAMKAPEEMRRLHNTFYAYLASASANNN